LFLHTFVVEPRLRTYYVTVECVGARGDAKSRMFRAGAVEQYDNPIDLGRLGLQR
jgi:hypothetical protein